MTHQPPAPERADQVRNGFRIVDDFMNVTEALFERFYKSLYRNRKTFVEVEKLRRASVYTKRLRAELNTTREDVALQQLEIKTKRRELARVTAALAVLDEGIILQDPQGYVELMNEAAKQLLGGVKYFWDSPLGQMFRELVHPHADPHMAGLVTPLDFPQKIEVNGKTLGVRLAAVYDDNGYLLGTVMVLSDTTQQNFAEKLKTSFVTQMSHELLTPLTSIKGMSDLLLNLPEGKPPDRRFLETISRNVAIMDRMIVELLDISEISSGTFSVHKNPLRIDQQVSYVLQGLEPRLRKAKLNVTLRVINTHQLDFLGDERRIQWALGHLIDNAINYTQADGLIVVELGRVRDGEMLIKVRDNGVGISNDDLPYIFDQFKRGTAKTPDGRLIDPRGLGQGLYVAKAVIEAHGGTLSVASKVGEGSTFTIALPLPTA